MGTRGYLKTIAAEVHKMIEDETYEIDVCKGMTIIEYKMPKNWIFSDKSYTPGIIFYSDVNEGSLNIYLLIIEKFK